MNDKQLNKRAYEVWAEDLTAKQKADKLNKEFGLTWVPRTWGQRSKNYSVGLEDGIEEASSDEELERIAKARARAMREQKIATLMRNPVHKEARAAALEKVVLDNFTKAFKGLVVKKTSPTRVINKKKDSIVFFKGDDHFDGSDESIKVQRAFYNKCYNLAKDKNKNHITMIFGGDECEGWLHKSTLVDATRTPEQQMLSFIQETISGLDMLSDDFTIDLYFLTSSNHTQTRQLNSNRNEFLKADLAMLGGEMLKIAFQKNKYINVQTASVFIDRTIKGLGDKKVVITHGGLGFETNNKKMVQQYKNADIILKAHTHVFKIEFEGNTMIITVPTLKTKVTDFEISNGFLKINEDVFKEELSWDAEFLEMDFDEKRYSIIKHTL